jgi:hypothetical protein
LGSRTRHRFYSILLVVPWLMALGAAVALVSGWREEGRAVPLIDPEPEKSWRSRYSVGDPVVGWRARRSVVSRHRGAPLGGQPVRHVRVHNNLGLIRSDDLTELPEGRRVLLVGDSHLMGVVSNHENAADVLEQLARETSGRADWFVFNASCGNYSLYQYVLRARTLMERLKPDTLLVVIFAGNDLLELEDVQRPHIDDRGAERPAASEPVPETMTRRLLTLGLTQDQQGLFWQGLNQATYLRDYPQRQRPMLSKMRRSLELLVELASHHEVTLLVAVLPSFDLIFPDRVAAMSEPLQRLMARNVNVNLYASLVSTLYELGIPTVDLRNQFRVAERDGLYADDYHIYVGGHRVVAEALLTPLLAPPP